MMVAVLTVMEVVITLIAIQTFLEPTRRGVRRVPRFHHAEGDRERGRREGDGVVKTPPIVPTKVTLASDV